MDERIRARRQAVRLAHVRRRRRLWVSFGAAVVIGALVVVAARSPLFAITGVEVEGVAPGRASEVVTAAGVVEGENLLSADLTSVAARVRALPWVDEAQVRRVPPATVVIEVTPRLPVAVVRVGPAAWMVDAEAVLVGGGTQPGLVTIDAPNAVLPAAGMEVADAAVRAALDVHAGLPTELRSRIDAYEAHTPRGIRAHLMAAVAPPSQEAGAEDDDAAGIWVRIGAAERVADKGRVVLALLDQLQRQAELAGEAPSVAEIDVRAADNPVVIPRT